MQLIYNVVLVLVVEQSDSVIYLYMHVYSFTFSSIVGCYKKFSVLYNRYGLVIYFTYDNVMF